MQMWNRVRVHLKAMRIWEVQEAKANLNHWGQIMIILKIAGIRTQWREFKICNRTDNKIRSQHMPREIKEAISLETKFTIRVWQTQEVTSRSITKTKTRANILITTVSAKTTPIETKTFYVQFWPWLKN